MANNIVIEDGGSASQTMKTTDNGGVHTPHHNVDASALPTGAATESKQDDSITELQNTVTELQNVVAELQALNNHDQKVVAVAVDTDGAVPAALDNAGAVVAAVAAKYLVLERVIFEEDGSTGGTPPSGGNLIMLELTEETSGLLLGRKWVAVSDVNATFDRVIEIDFGKGIRLPTVNKGIFAKFSVFDTGGAAQAEDVSGRLTVVYREED